MKNKIIRLKGGYSFAKAIKRANRRAAFDGSVSAFRKWRGKRPASGYGYDLMKWDYEDRDMRLAWDAAVAWAMTQNTTDQARGSRAKENA